MFAPIVLPPPARLSTTTVWPKTFVSRSDRRRAITSLLPPGAKGTTMRIGLVGHGSAAKPAPENTAAPRIEAASVRRRKREGMAGLSGRVDDGTENRSYAGDTMGTSNVFANG